MLLNLLELASSKAITRKYKFDLRPRTRTAKINNTIFCFKFMGDEGIARLNDRAAEQIIDNHVPSVLTVLWQLVVFYHLYPLFPQKDYRTAFLLWAEKKMNCKLCPSSWTSGEAFYRLCRAIHPDGIPPLQTIQENLLGNMINVMEADFKVPQGMINDKEFQQSPSDLPVLMSMVYLARFRIEQFREERKKMIAEMASDRLCCLSTLPEELLVNVMALMSDPLPWLFINC